MAPDSDLPCDGEGTCMVCKKKPTEDESLTCKTCATPWHVTCLSIRPQTLAHAAQWDCPDCSFVANPGAPTFAPGNAAVPERSGLIAAVRVIEDDQSLTEQEKAKRRQYLLSGGGQMSTEAANHEKAINGGGNDILHLLDERLNCSFCMQLPERPVTTPCGHNFCLKCFQKWVGQGKHTCANCRHAIPAKMASNPRINSSLVTAIRMAKMSKANCFVGPPKVHHFVHNQNRPDKAYTTERAKKSGKANACSGKIFVTVPPDHFGPIQAENVPDRKQGILVGETWVDRLECRQWGVHLPHVAGISGQSDYGAQSVALSGGYEDDEDHGEWFLYTGSGGRDLSGNKRTNKTQSFDQKFEKQNEALRVSCRKGYPVRVVRSHKEKRSSYAPEKGVRYDGIYRIEKCWRKAGIQGFKVCRYLFVRCDNDPAPWTSDDHGDRPRPLPNIEELKTATDITERKGSPSWDYDGEKGNWMWIKPPPESRKQADSGNLQDGNSTRKVRRHTQTQSVRARLLKEFSCLFCRKVMVMPLTTPCAHNFCKSCLEGAFAGQTFIRQRTCEGRRTLRAQKNIMKCPSCSFDISDFLQNPQVNREVMNVIELLQRQSKEMEENVELGEEMGSDGENVDPSEETEDTEEKTVELIKENDDTDKKSNGVTRDTNVCNMNHETPEEDKEGKQTIVKSPNKTQTQNNYKRKKADDNDHISTETFHIHNTVNGDLGAGDVKPEISDDNKLQASPVGSKTKKPYLQKMASDSICSSTLGFGVQTRGKKAKLVADDDFE